MESKKYSILTYIFGNYEFVREPLETDDECEYVLVTDNKNLKSKKWKIVYLSDDFNDYTPISKTFYVRYHPFEFVNTDYVLLLDGSMHIKKSLHKLFNDFQENDYDCALGSFPFRIRSVNELYDYWIKNRNYNITQANKNRAFYNATHIGLPKIYHETGYMLFKKCTICLQFLETVYSAINKISLAPNDLDRLDQPIFNGILNALYQEMRVLSLSRELVQSDFIKFYYHNTNKECRVNIDPLFNKEFYKL